MLSCFLVEETTEVAVLAFAPVVFRRGMKKARSDNVNLRACLVAVAGTAYLNSVKENPMPVRKSP